MNILWIFCDELRTDALECYGNRYTRMHTPNIDRLADRGVLFEQCFVDSPVCVSSRFSMHTGLPPERTGVYHNEAYSAYPLADSFATFPETLAVGGFATADFGKEHIPRSVKPWMHSNPEGAGMEAFRESGVSFRSMDLIRTPVGFVIGGRFPTGHPYPPERVSENTLAWIAEAPEPFLARASYLQPHTPVITPEPYLARYDKAPFPDRVEHRGRLSAFERRFGEINGGEQLSPEQFRGAQVYYYALVSWIDHEVGRLLDGLKQMGLLDRTVVVLAADHGAHLGEGGAYGKQTFAPQSHRIPLIVAKPGSRGGRRSDLARGLDFAKTFCGLAEIEPDPSFQGRDLFDSSAPEAVFGSIGYGEQQSRSFPNIGIGELVEGRGWPRRSCIRTARYRLDRTTRLEGVLAQPADWDVFLADRSSDPEEVFNVADNPDFADVRRSLLAELDREIEDAIETPVGVVYPG